MDISLVTPAVKLDFFNALDASSAFPVFGRLHQRDVWEWLLASVGILARIFRGQPYPLILINGAYISRSYLQRMYVPHPYVEKLVRKAVSMAHVGPRNQEMPPSGVEISHKITAPTVAPGQRSQTFEAKFIYGGPGAKSLVRITVDGFEVFRALIGPNYRDNPERIEIEVLSIREPDWRASFMALDVYPSVQQSGPSWAHL